MLDKVVMKYTRDGIVSKNLATGESHLAIESDYAKELKYSQPKLENQYHSPYEHPEFKGHPKEVGNALNHHSGNKEIKHYYHFNSEQAHSTKKADMGNTPKTSLKENQYSSREPYAKENAPPDIKKQTTLYQSPLRSGMQKRKRHSSRQDFLNRLSEQIIRTHDRSKHEEEENLGVQTSGTIYRTADRLRFGIHSIIELNQRRRMSYQAAKKAAEYQKQSAEAIKRSKRASRAARAAQSSSAQAGKAVGEASSILKHPAAAKFILVAVIIFGGIMLLCTLLGGASGSFIGSATEHPELTSYVQQLDEGFLNKISSAIASYEQKGDDVTVEGNENIATDPGSLAILVTKDWTVIDLTPENKAKLEQCHAILNSYSVSSSDETVSDGKSKKTIHHVKISIHIYAAEEKIDAFGYTPEMKSHVLEMLGILHQIEAESGNAGSGNISGNVLSYQSLVDQYCAQYGISGYSNLVLAVMQQESGGQGKDPMQCSECGYNTRFPHTPNSITDPAYSIQCGVQNLAACLRAAKCKSPSDTPGISLALQGYNFGNGYIAWALQRGGYSQANAIEFSQMEAKKAGTSGYGDVNYVCHVLKYYNSLVSGTYITPLKAGTYRISRGYGYDGGELHKGIDFAAPAGTPIYASASGTVIYAQYGSAPYGGYGNVVVIKHGNNYETLYGHCSKLLVKKGQQVQQGAEIALVGSTGDSTGNHCHFEIRVNGTKVDPAKYLKGVLKN
ncbi:MAG TPA: lysozyme family protein [Caproicibacter sp.]|nr:lysozyme family protein [Caproicibacter sp.]